MPNNRWVKPNQLVAATRILKFVKTVRKFLRMVIPEWFLTYYRWARTIHRFLFFRPRNLRMARYYRSLILSRFPELKKNGNIGLVIDLGANIGNFTHACRLMGYEVIAVEPHPQALEYLSRRFKNDVGVRIISGAIGRHEGESELHFHEDHIKDPIHTSISATTVTDKFSESHTVARVKKFTLGKLLNSFGTVAIVKSDIEGAEYEIIPDLLANGMHVERVLIETHLRFMQMSTIADEYINQLNSLDNYIAMRNLENRWLTDWV